MNEHSPEMVERRALDTLRTAIISARTSSSELSKKTGISRSLISGYLRNERSVNLRTLNTLYAAVDLPMLGCAVTPTPAPTPAAVVINKRCPFMSSPAVRWAVGLRSSMKRICEQVVATYIALRWGS